MDELLAEYLDSRKARLDELYQWKFDEATPRTKFGINITAATWLEKTCQLKTALYEQIRLSTELTELEELAKYFINDWGRITRFAQARNLVQQFRTIIGTNAPPDDFKTPFQSISSWSKWASLVCPQWALIYDTRVASSINAINFIGGGSHKIFPTPEGRNTRLNILDISTILLSAKVKRADASDPKELRRKYFVPRSSAYREYLALVSSVSRRLWGDQDHIHEIEMMLFAIADEDVYEDSFRKLQALNSNA